MGTQRAILALAVMVVASACSGGGSSGSGGSPSASLATGRAATAEDLTGIWVREGVGLPFLRFEEDGTFAGDNFRERLYAESQAHGTFEVEDGTITITMDDAAGGCTPSDVWVWEATLLAEGRLVTVTIDDGLTPCSTTVGAERRWIRIGTT